MSTRPTLRVSTPLTANFPHIPPSASDLRSAVSLPSAVSANTPLSAISRTSAFRDFRDPIPSSGLPSAGLPSAGPFSATIKLEHDLLKTPITPPVAYLDFLKGMSLISPCLASPPQTGRSMLNRASTTSTVSSTSSARSNDSNDSHDSNPSNTSTETEDSDKEKGDQIESAPSTARSELSCECKVEEDKEKTKNSKPAPIDIKRPPPTPRGAPSCPMSAPPAGPTVFPSMKLPASPAVSTSGLYSPRSPLSGASGRSAFDWDAALKSRRFAETPGSKRPAAPETPGLPPTSASATTPGHAKRDSRSSIRHIREVVTRTVTYTPRMAPAPKGKRRKIDAETAVKS